MTLADWGKLLDGDPLDQALRAAYADWLEEQGHEDEAAVQRALAAGKVAVGYDTVGATRGYADMGLWDVAFPRTTHEEAVALCDLLKAASGATRCGGRGNYEDDPTFAHVPLASYATRERAEGALLAIWPQLEKRL
jgi:uncharacterized protein (TIGR02996 family)